MKSEGEGNDAERRGGAGWEKKRRRRRNRSGGGEGKIGIERERWIGGEIVEEQGEDESRIYSRKGGPLALSPELTKARQDLWP